MNCMFTGIPSQQEQHFNFYTQVLTSSPKCQVDPNSSTNLALVYGIEAGGVRILIINISKKKVLIKGQFSRVH